MSDYKGALIIGDDVKAKMEEEKISEEDVRAVIGEAEETGVKMRNEEATQFVAKLKINDVFVNAEYKTAGDGFEVVDVYWYRTEVTGW